MPSRKAEPRKVWEADVTLNVKKLALGCQYVEFGKGSQTKRNLVAQDWLAKDKQTIIFDVGKHLKGWLKEQALTLGGQTKRDLLSYGIVCKSLPNGGYEEIGKLSDVLPSRTWESFAKRSDYVLNGMPEPEAETIQTKEGRTVFALCYVLGKDIEMKAKIHSFARGLDHDLIKDWLEKLGTIKGLGDKHNASSGYGTFELREFNFLGEKDLRY